MMLSIEKKWQEVLKGEWDRKYFKQIQLFLSAEKADKNIVYPKEKNIFEAFNSTPFDQVKVVILGQDPYHGKNQAHGLSFSVQEGISHPPSLVNIYKEACKDIGIPYPESGNLSKWAKQGVLLLNASLTVRASEANSHQKIGWQLFTDEVIKSLSDRKEGLVFLLWGGFAKKKGAKINQSKHFVLTCGHPSPLSANRGFWFGNKHFSKTNEILKRQGKSQIDWQIK